MQMWTGKLLFCLGGNLTGLVSYLERGDVFLEKLTVRVSFQTHMS